MINKEQHSTFNFVSYLDVCEYIIKEASPLLQPSPQQCHPEPLSLMGLVPLRSAQALSADSNCIRSHPLFKIIQILASEESYQIESINGSPSHVVLTPITSGLIRMQMQDIMDDFMLESPEYGSQEEEAEGRRKKPEKGRGRKCSTLELFKLESDLDKIVEYDHDQSYQSDYPSSLSSIAERIDEEHCGLNSNTLYTSWSKRTDSNHHLTKDIDLEYQTTVDTSIVDYSENIECFSRNPKQEILNQIKDIEALPCTIDNEEKKNLVKKHLENYLLEYEGFCFEEAWKEIAASANADFSLIKEGIEETFNKKFGSLSFECRRVKLLKYLEKKKRRIWKKKVSYDCRKKVADGRLRIKGKFVTREQACEQLGVDNLDNYSPEEIKDMLERKMDEGLEQAIC